MKRRAFWDGFVTGVPVGFVFGVVLLTVCVAVNAWSRMP